MLQQDLETMMESNVKTQQMIENIFDNQQIMSKVQNIKMEGTLQAVKEVFKEITKQDI